MTTQPHVAYIVRESGEHSYWTAVGVAFPNKLGFTVLLDAVPAPDEGRFKIIVLPPKAPEADRAIAARTKARARNR